MSKDLGTQRISFNLIDADASFNCRGAFLESEVADLANNIKRLGLIQKPALRQLNNGRYQLIAGFRRFAALKLLEYTECDFSIWDMTEVESIVYNLAENIERKDLNIQQEAEAVNNLYRKCHYTLKRISEVLRRGQSWVERRIEFYNLAPEAKALILAGAIPAADISKLIRIQTKCGHEHLISALRECQNAFDMKRKPRLIDDKKFKVKKVRSKSDIELMSIYLGRTLPHYLTEPQIAGLQSEVCFNLVWPKALAWASGNISTDELFESCDELCKIVGKKFEYPNDHPLAEVKL